MPQTKGDSPVTISDRIPLIKEGGADFQCDVRLVGASAGATGAGNEIADLGRPSGFGVICLHIYILYSVFGIQTNVWYARDRAPAAAHTATSSNTCAAAAWLLLLLQQQQFGRRRHPRCCSRLWVSAAPRSCILSRLPPLTPGLGALVPATPPASTAP